MCGIFCCISQDHTKNWKQWETCKDLIKNRGPDKLDDVCITISEEWVVLLTASVLWMQGSEPISQPSQDSDGNVLLWNGDIFSGELANDNISDTTTVLNALRNSDVISVLSGVKGPYSFIYFQKSTQHLYFGRDCIGRHSLLMNFDDEENTFTLTSVGPKSIRGLIEVPAIGIFVINLSNTRLNLACYPWKEPDLRFTDVIELLETNLNIDIDIKQVLILSGISTLDLHLNPNTEDLEYLESISCNENFLETLQYLSENNRIVERVTRLLDLLHKSVELRVTKMPNYCQDCLKRHLRDDYVTCNHSKVGILFSGGLDSSILALIAHKFIPQNQSIDLINVAFERPSNGGQKNDRKIDTADRFNVPDRKTGHQTFLELTRMYPSRQWNFLEVDVTQEELQLHRTSRISNLLYPCCTILDESIGCAIWFASRAKGTLSPENTQYKSPCRILLLGMGADELFGGYMRHRTVLKHRGWDALSEELSIELARISERNLGRDDRIVSDHGRQSRLPYLDEDFIEYVQQLKPWERCYPVEKLPPGLGDKLLLRLLAYKLGFQCAAIFPKRAFQFGSRIANSKENARDISNRL